MAGGLRRRLNGGSRLCTDASGSRWVQLPQGVWLLICEHLKPAAVARLAAAHRDARSLSFSEELWRFFCCLRWPRCANLKAYRSARNLYRDRNGWHPRCGSRRQLPSFKIQHTELRESSGQAMDMRMVKDEVIAVMAASGRQADAWVVDLATAELRETLKVSSASINCCDVGRGLLLMGGDDCKVHLYSKRTGTLNTEGAACSYRPITEYLCRSPVNDLRLAREDTIAVVRTYEDRVPASVDLVPLERPDTLVSFPGGGWATGGKYIHALDGFAEGCSLRCMAFSGEDPLSGVHSAMLFDFRRPLPCVVDLPIAPGDQGYPVDTRLWPFRAGREPMVYANLYHEDFWQKKGMVAAIDFRYASVCTRFQLPQPVDDFHCLSDGICAVCTQPNPHLPSTSLHRCTARHPQAAECMLQLPVAPRGPPDECLTFLSVCQRGFAMSCGNHLVTGTIADPRA